MNGQTSTPFPPHVNGSGHHYAATPDHTAILLVQTMDMRGALGRIENQLINHGEALAGHGKRLDRIEWRVQRLTTGKPASTTGSARSWVSRLTGGSPIASGPGQWAAVVAVLGMILLSMMGNTDAAIQLGKFARLL